VDRGLGWTVDWGGPWTGVYSVLGTQYSVLLVLSVFSVLSTQYSILSTKYSVLITQYSVLSVF